MRRFKSHTIGVEDGEALLFDDFEDGGQMWTERGQREVRVPVRFSEAFTAPPSVWVGLAMWDIAANANARIDLRAEEITNDGFTISFRTWDDTRIARARASWQALGPVRDEDEWEVD